MTESLAPTVDSSRRLTLWFVLAEVLLVLAVPVLAFLGVRTLLGSRAGVFVADAGPADPGYRALVDLSPVTAVVEVTEKRISGLVLVTQPGAGEAGGSLVIVSADLLVDGVPLGSLGVPEAVAALERALNLRIPAVEVAEESRWNDILGLRSYVIDNPDPVPGATGAPRFDVGPVIVDGFNAGAFLGSVSPDGSAQSLVFRRQVFWAALLERPPESSDAVAALLRSVAAGRFSVEALPTVPTTADVNGAEARGLMVDAAEAEELLHEIVPFPGGAEPGDRLRVSIIDRTGDADLLAIAARLGSSGYEVVNVGNASTFEAQAETELVVPLGVVDDRVDALARLVGAAVRDSEQIDADADGVVTLLVGVGDR